MNSKITTRYLPLILVIALVLTFGLVMAYAPTATTTAGAEITLPGEYMYDGGHTYFSYGENKFASDYNFLVVSSGTEYNFDKFVDEFYEEVGGNSEFCYPLGTSASAFISGASPLWTVTVYENDLSTTKSVDLRAYYASYDYWGNPVEYLDADPTEPGLYCVVLCVGDESDPEFDWQANPYCPVIVQLYQTVNGYCEDEDLYMDCPVQLRKNTFTWGDVKYHDILSAAFETTSYGSEIARLDPSYSLPLSAVIVDDQNTTIDSYNGSSFSQSDAYPDAGTYTLRVFFYNTKMDSYQADYTFTVTPAPLSYSVLYGHLDAQAEYMYVDLGTNPSGVPFFEADVKVQWMYDDNGTPAVLPTGRDLVPGTYQVWATLTGADAANCELVSVDYNGSYEISETEPATLTVHNKDIGTLELTTADFTSNSYSDRDTYGFLKKADEWVNNMATSKGAYCEAYWYYFDDETPVKFDEFADAANYNLNFCLYGEDAKYFDFAITVDGESWDSKDYARENVTVDPYVLDDVSICYGSGMGMPLNMYKAGDAEANNDLYCAPTGFVLTASSAGKTEVSITIEGWKQDLDDDEEEVTTDITNVLGTWYAVGINAPDSNYTVDPTIRCKVTVNQRVFEIIGSASANYTGEEVKPFYNVMSSQFNPGEAISWDDPSVKKLLFTDGLNNEVLGTSVGSGYHYGVEVKDNTRYVIYHSGSNHISIDWAYEVTESLPTITFSTDGKEAFWHKESLTTADDLAKKLEWILTTNDPELFPDDQVELDTDYGTGGFKFAMYDDPYTWYDGIPTAMNKGDTFRIQIKTTESASGNYLAWEGTTDWFTVQAAPVYIVWDNQHDFIYNDVSQGPALGDFNYYLYHPGTAEGGVYAAVQDSMVFDQYGYWTPDNVDEDNDTVIWSVTQSIEGTTSELWAGTYTMTFELKDNSTLLGIENYVLVGNTVTWKILQKEIEISQFSIPGTFTYGGYAGGSNYYDLPIISYVEASDGDEYGDMVIGTATGFGATLPNQYRIAFETWEFALRTDVNVAADEYTGAWTVWDTSDAEHLVVPKDAGTYYVRYSAFFCQVTSWNETYWTASEWNADHKTYYVDYQYAIIVIEPMAIELTWNGLENTYDADSHAATINATLCYGENLADWISFTDTAYTDYKEGGYTLTATVADNDNGTKNYTITNPTATLNINKAYLTVTPSSYNIYYGDARPAYGYTLTGFLEAEGETQADKEANLKWLNRLSGAPTISCDYSQFDDIGNYEITVSVGTLSALNYEFDVTAVAGVHVDPKAIIVTINDRSSTYGDAFAGFSSTDNGIVNDDQGVYSLTIHTVADGVKGDAFSIGTTTAVGTYYIFGTAEDANYSITFSTAHDVLVGEDEVAVATYEVLNATITGTLEQSGTLTYNGGNQTASVSNTLASVNEQGITVTYGTTLGVYDSAAVPQFKNVVGTKTVYWQAVAANHNTKTGSFTVTIDPKEVTVAFDPADLKKTYDGTAIKPDGVGVISGTVDGEALTVVFDGANRYRASKYDATFTLAADNEQTVVTNYTLVAVGTPDPNVVDGNYSVSAEVGTVTVQVLQRTIEFVQKIDGENATSVTYNGAAKVFSLSFTNKVGGDDVYLYLSTTQGGAGAATQTETVKAAYTYYVIFGGDEDLLGSYNLSDEDAQVTFTIAEKTITVTYALENYGEFTYGDTTAFNTLKGINNKANFYGMLTLSEALSGGEAVADVIDLSFKKGGVITEIGATADVGKYVLYATIKEGVTNYAFNFDVNSDEKAYINITKKALTARWNLEENGELHEDNADHWFEFVYDGTPKQAVAALVGVEDGDDVSITYGSYSTTTDVWTNGGHHTTTIVGITGEDAGNYSIDLSQAWSANYFVILPKPITVNWGTTAFTYTGAGQAPTVGITGGSIVAGDAADISLVEPTKEVKANAVNANYTATVSLSGNKAANYTITNSTCDFTIAPYEVTPALYIDDELVDGDNGSVTYDGNNHVFVIKATGLNEDVVIFFTSVNDEHINVFSSGTGYNAGYRGHATGVFDMNYAVDEYCYFNWAITARPLSLNWALEANGDYSGEQFPGYKTFTDFIYNGEKQHPVADLLNVVGDEDVEIVYPEGIKNAITNGGYHAYEIVSFKGNAKNNYVWANDAEKKVYFDLKAKPITVTYTSTAKSATYGATAEWDALGDAMEANNYYLAADLGSGDDIFDVVSVKMINGSSVDVIPDDELAVGTYYLVATDLNNTNYDVTIALGDNAKLTVTKATLTEVSVEQAAVLTYNGALQTAAVNTAATAVNDMDVVFTYSADDGKTYGEAGVVPAFKDAGNHTVFYIASAANHENFGGSFTVTIAKKAITLTYNQDAPLVYTYGDASIYNLNPYAYIDGYKTGFAMSDLAVLQANPLAIFQYIPLKINGILAQNLNGDNFGYAATYALTIDPATVNANYEATVELGDNAKLVIEPKDLFIRVDNQIVTYGDEAAAFTVKYEGFVTTVTEGDDEFNYGDSEAKLQGTLAFACDYTTESGVGSYKITASGVSNGNYTVKYIDGVVLVIPRVVTLTWGDAEFTYDKTAKLPTVKLGNLVNDDTVTATVTGEATVAGEHVATVTALSDTNYTLPTETTEAFTIAKKVITVTAEDKWSYYKDDLAALTFTGAIEAGDEVCTAATNADKNTVGEYTITLTSTNNPNYVVTLVNGKYLVKEAKTEIKTEGGEQKAESYKDIKVEDVAKDEGVSIIDAVKSIYQAATEANVPVAALELEIGEDATVTFDKAALEKLAGNADVKITYKETQVADVDQSNKDLKSAQLVIEISLNGATFEGGKATITTKFENKAPGGKKAVVYYVDENGKKTDMNATFENGEVTFETTHFSTYVVEYVLTGGSIAGIVIACVVGVAGIAVGVFFFLKKRKANGGNGGEAAADEAATETPADAE